MAIFIGHTVNLNVIALWIFAPWTNVSLSYWLVEPNVDPEHYKHKDKNQVVTQSELHMDSCDTYLYKVCVARKLKVSEFQVNKCYSAHNFTDIYTYTCESVTQLLGPILQLR